jgi:predicted acyltransferase
VGAAADPLGFRLTVREGRVDAWQKGPAGRVASLDQFRGYIVAAMFVVNSLGGLAAVPDGIKHHDTYFSFADSIMPGFLFASGISFRLSMLRRLARAGAPRAFGHALARSGGLVLLSLAMYGVNHDYKGWEQLAAEGVGGFFARLIKANLWEVLAIIGAAQVLILPVVAAGPRVRVGAMVGCLAAHAWLSHSFNFRFLYGRPNWMDAYWGAADTHCWDGGVFGLLSWAVPMLAGTLAYDILAAAPPPGAGRRLLGWGAALMTAGYALSCLTTLYDAAPGSPPTGDRLAASPVLPPSDALRARPLATLLAEPPFVAPPPARPLNYWMMSKRVVTAPFALFASGFAMALYGLFVLACDAGRMGVGMLGTLGRNPLFAYVIHHMVERSVRGVVPADSPLWWCLVGSATSFALTYGAVKYLERHGIFLRL